MGWLPHPVAEIPVTIIGEGPDGEKQAAAIMIRTTCVDWDTALRDYRGGRFIERVEKYDASLAMLNFEQHKCWARVTKPSVVQVEDKLRVLFLAPLEGPA